MTLGLATGARRAVLTAAVVLGCLLAIPVAAQTSPKDVQVAVRTLGFVANPPSGPVDLAILFDPAVPMSATDAQAAADTIGAGLRIGSATVRPVLLPVGELNRLAGFRFVLLTAGLEAHFEAVAEATRGRGILSISADFACVRAGRCVMAVASEPRVQVLVNRAASEAAAVEFAAAFRLMITEM